MSDDNRIVQAAQFLLEEHRARRPFGPIPAPCAAHTVDEAYAVQEALHALIEALACLDRRLAAPGVRGLGHPGAAASGRLSGARDSG